MPDDAGDNHAVVVESVSARVVRVRPEPSSRLARDWVDRLIKALEQTIKTVNENLTWEVVDQEPYLVLIRVTFHNDRLDIKAFMSKIEDNLGVILLPKLEMEEEGVDDNGFTILYKGAINTDRIAWPPSLSDRYDIVVDANSRIVVCRIRNRLHGRRSSTDVEAAKHALQQAVVD